MENKKVINLVDFYDKSLKVKSITSFTDLLESEGYTYAYLEDYEVAEDNLTEYFNYWTSFVIKKSKKLTLCKVYKHKILDVYLKNHAGMIVFYYRHDDTDLEKIVDLINEISMPVENKTPMLYIVKTDSSGYTKLACKIEPFNIDINTMYNDDFLPVYDRLVDKLNNTKKGIVFLHGEAGTGKTNLIKHLTIKVPNKNLIIIPSSFIPELSSPSFLEFLINNNNSILVLEDCESYLKERGGNGTDCVSSLLNISDGIMTDFLNIQVICTFNTTLQNIDKALLRKGRLIVEYEFKQLELEKAKALAKSLNVQLPKTLTLSEIFNADEETLMSKVTRKMGFSV